MILAVTALKMALLTFELHVEIRQIGERRPHGRTCHVLAPFGLCEIDAYLGSGKQVRETNSRACVQIVWATYMPDAEAARWMIQGS